MPGLPPALFADLLYGMRQAGLDVGLNAWMTLMEALQRGAVPPDLTDFYYVARSLLVKSETYFDLWDQVFAAVFADGELPSAAAEELLEWLQDPKELPELNLDDLAALEKLPLDKLRELFEERMKEQDERHDGGNRWIGTGGTSPFGHSGANPAGVRVGGSGGSRSAVQIASKRLFRGYRDDRIIDTRAMAVALKKLRRLSRHEGELELDIDETIDKTCRNAGELDLVLRPPRKNQARVLLLMDVGGSMDPYVRLVETLFSAASGLHHWRKLESFSFHNCPYEMVYPKEFGGDGIPTGDLMKERPKNTFLIMVGDASMAPSELVERNGAINYWHRNDTPGIAWLHRLRSHFDRAIWLNPMPPRWWNGWTTRLIGELFAMFPLTVRGLEEAVDHLIKGRSTPLPDLDPRIYQQW